MKAEYIEVFDKQQKTKLKKKTCDYIHNVKRQWRQPSSLSTVINRVNII